MNKEVSTKAIESKILTIRNQPVMLDRDLAELYGVETRRLNEQVKRNIERFPDSFMFQLTREEIEIVKSQIVTSKMENELVMSQIATSPETNTSNMFSGQDGGTRKLPYAFTEQGVAMLSAVLKSDTAIQMSIQIMNAFVSMRHFLHSNARLFVELDSIKQHLIRSDIHQKETDKKVQELFSLIDKYNVKETQGIFFQGQIFDAYAKRVVVLMPSAEIKTQKRISDQKGSFVALSNKAMNVEPTKDFKLLLTLHAFSAGLR